MSNSLGYSGIPTSMLKLIKENPKLVDFYFLDVEDLQEKIEGDLDWARKKRDGKTSSGGIIKYFKGLFSEQDNTEQEIDFSDRKIIDLPGNWPEEEVDYFGCEDLNHRNSLLYHRVMEESSAYTETCGSIFGCWKGGNKKAYTLHSEAWCIENLALKEIIECIDKLTIKNIKDGANNWFIANDVGPGMCDEEAEARKNDFVEFGLKIKDVYNKELDLIWTVS